MTMKLPENYLEDLISKIHTSQKAVEIISILDSLSSDSYRTDRKILEPHFRALDVACPGISALFQDKSAQEIRDLAAELRNALLAIEKIKVEMSYRPSKDFILDLRKIFELIHKKSDFLLDISIDPSLENVARFYYAGKFYSVSLLSYIKDKMRKASVKI